MKTQIIGRKTVREALQRNSPAIEKVYLSQAAGGKEVSQIKQLASASSIPFQFVPEARLTRMCPKGNHQGVIAHIAMVKLWDVDDMLQSIAPVRDDVVALKPMLLVLDRIEDPHNFGAILRSALAGGVSGIIIPAKHMAPLSDVAIKTSAGAALQSKIARVSNLAKTLYQLKERGYWIVGADHYSKDSMHTFDWKKPIALVMGSESKGMQKTVQEQCDAIVSIPMYGPVESLNVSVATALLVFNAAHSRTIAS